MGKKLVKLVIFCCCRLKERPESPIFTYVRVFRVFSFFFLVGRFAFEGRQSGLLGRGTVSDDGRRRRRRRSVRKADLGGAGAADGCAPPPPPLLPLRRPRRRLGRRLGRRFGRRQSVQHVRPVPYAPFTRPFLEGLSAAEAAKISPFHPRPPT